MSKLKQINDESYSLHLSLVATGNNIVADSISLNLRPRFSHISRQDLIQSAIANAKNGDVFRDIKASFDTSGEEGVSDILIAKALRLRLLKEKEEFIASKLEAAAAVPDPVISEQDAKKSSPAAKKEVVDPKAAKKPPVKGKVEEEVAPKVETSKRKNKIREKSARDAKIESDEPTDGPDQYIMLKGFDSLTLITSMIEDQEIPISSILRAIDFPSADLKGKPYVSENEVLNTFDGFIELMRGKISIMDSYLWKSLVFVDVKGTFESVKEFYDAMAKSIYNVVYTKKTWSTYYKDNLIISVPLEKEAPMSRYYESLCDSVKERNAELIFGFLLESLCKDDISYEENALDYYLEKQLAKFINAPVSDSGLQTDILRWGDDHAQLTFKLKELSLFEINGKSFLKSIRSTFMLEKFLSILQKSLNKITPSALEYSNKKNMILKDLISRSINAGLRQTSRIFLQFDFETMCAKELNEYCWVERLDPVSMSQVFTNAFTNKSDFKVKYSESENGLLICLTNYGGHERLEHKSIDMVVRARLCFGLFYDLIRQDKREYIGKNVNIIIPAPVQKKESSTDVLSKSPESTLDIIQPIIEPVVDNSTIYDTFDKVIQIKEDLSIINTSDGSRIEVCNISSMCIGDSTSIKYFWKDDILSFSNSRATYSSSGVIFNIQLDSKGLRLDLSFDGLMVSFGNDVVIQKRWGIVDQNSLSSNVFMLDERDTICSRLSFKNGTTVVNHGDESTIIFTSDGSFYVKEDNNWSCTSQQGFRFKTDANGKIIEKLGKIRASTEFDSLLEQVTITREDFVNISVVGIAPTKNYFSFSKSTKGSVDYFDGTSISSDKGTIEIKHSLYASVTFNEGVSRVTLPNGVVIEKNGSKFTIKTSNSLVQFDESGNLYHLPVLAANDQLESVFTGKKTLSSIDLSSLPHVHIMNIKNDTYLHTDFDSTISEVKNNIASVSGKGELPKNSLLHVSPGTLTNNLISHFATSTHSSSITEPENVSFNSPRLFLINIDGSGVELLRDRDMYLELRRQLHNKKSEIMEERVEGEDGSVCVTILDHGAVNSNNGKAVVRHPMFDPVTNAAIKKEIQETKQKNIEQETPVEKGNVEDSRDRKFVFGLDNLLTERAIYTKFLLKKSLVKQVYELGAPVVVRRASKLLPKPDDRQTITSLMESVKDKIESNVEEEREASDTVPNYFESTDGKLFLKGDKKMMSTRPIVKPDSPKQSEVKKEPEIQEKIEPEIKDKLPVAVEPTFSISPNSKYKATDSSTRRSLKTSSTIKSLVSSTLVITPKTSVNFSIKSTESKTITINISNIGNDVARIRLVQPTCSWCKVAYKGGPIAAGLSVGIDVNVIGQGTPGVFKDCFKIVGESEIFTVPVIANLK